LEKTSKIIKSNHKEAGSEAVQQSNRYVRNSWLNQPQRNRRICHSEIAGFLLSLILYVSKKLSNTGACLWAHMDVHLLVYICIDLKDLNSALWSSFKTVAFYVTVTSAMIRIKYQPK